MFPIKTGEQIVDLCQTNYSQPHHPKCSVVLNECFWPCSDLKQRLQEIAEHMRYNPIIYNSVARNQVEAYAKDLLLMSKACEVEKK